MSARRRTLKGIRADLGGMKQADAAKKLGMHQTVYCMIEQFVDDPSIAEAIGKLYGVKIEVVISDAK